MTYNTLPPEWHDDPIIDRAGDDPTPDYEEPDDETDEYRDNQN